MTTLNPLSRILETNKLSGPNFIDWKRNLRLVLVAQRIGYVLDIATQALDASATPEQIATHQQWKLDDKLARCYIIRAMVPELQRQYRNFETAHEILLHLQELYGVESRTSRFQISRELFRCTMSEGTSVNDHGLKMIGMIERLAGLGFIMDAELSIDLLLASLPDSFSQFVINFYMLKSEPTLSELLAMLRTAEGSLKKGKAPVLLVGTPSKPGKGKASPFKGKAKKTPWKPKSVAMKPVVEKAADLPACFHCGKLGHFKRDCKVYLAHIKNAPKKAGAAKK